MNIKDSLKFGVMIGLLEVHKVVSIMMWSLMLWCYIQLKIYDDEYMGDDWSS